MKSVFPGEKNRGTNRTPVLCVGLYSLCQDSVIATDIVDGVDHIRSLDNNSAHL